jgi:starch phosphorylase
MKFMLNGAVTLGTMDGANIEIFEQVGKENIYIFGAIANEISNLEINHSYQPLALFNSIQDIREAVSRLTDGTLPVSDPHRFDGIYNSLLYGDYDRADKYFVLHDFEAYRDMFDTVLNAYTDRQGWTKKAAMNTACAGIFSADRTVDEYNRLIWRLGQ